MQSSERNSQLNKRIKAKNGDASSPDLRNYEYIQPSQIENDLRTESSKDKWKFDNEDISYLTNLIVGSRTLENNRDIAYIIKNWAPKIADFEKQRIENINSSLTLKFRKGFKLPKIDHKNIKTMIEKNCDRHVSLRKMLEIYNEDHKNYKISLETLRRYIKYRLGLRFLRPCLKVTSCRTNQNLVMRMIFLKSITNLMKSGSEIIFIDGSTFNNKKLPFKIWIKPSDRMGFYSSSRFQSIYLLLAITKEQIVHYEISDNTINAETITSFLEEMYYNSPFSLYFRILDSSGKLWVYLDNAKYNTGNKVKQYIQSKKKKVIFGVPYMPSYNPVETVFSSIKAQVYRRLYNTR